MLVLGHPVAFLPKSFTINCGSRFSSLRMLFTPWSVPDAGSSSIESRLVCRPAAGDAPRPISGEGACGHAAPEMLLRIAGAPPLSSLAPPPTSSFVSQLRCAASRGGAEQSSGEFRAS